MKEMRKEGVKEGGGLTERREGRKKGGKEGGRS